VSKTDVRNKLLDAIDTGEVLLVRYSGGTQPGTIRQISPVGFVGSDKIRAACLATGRDKLYFFSKMEIIDSSDRSLVTYDPDFEDLYSAEEKPGCRAQVWRIVKWFLWGYLALVIILIIYALVSGFFAASP
jgi:predicted DNA-binding transcriptional regulator YafY